MGAASNTRGLYRRMPMSFDDAEVVLDEGLGCLHKMITASAMATSATSIGGERAGLLA